MTWIKICGMTTSEAVAAALAAGVNAIGFVFAESPRQLSPASAVRLAAPARGRVACAAVMRHPSQEHLDEVLRLFLPDLLQTDAEDLRTLQIPTRLAVLPVIRHWQHDSGTLPSRVLFEGPHSGVGMRSDWSSASRLARQAELILAGGLNPDNIAAAMLSVQPFGVDVSSGVEQRRGIKDPAEIARFVAAVRARDAAHAQPAEESTPGAPRAPREQEK
ncbi:MAG TPA: hypothetical protein VGL55_10735 [Steroidobacteraceae bacterium]|jgi:phosphoribosylanthranilate isomerase